MIKLKNILKNSILQECIITHCVLNGKVILAKNRDRAYCTKMSVVRELIDAIEIVYILDNDTDWSEGMNSKGIGILNSALMVIADENEKKIIKKKGKTGPDGDKIRGALSKNKLSDTIQSITSYKGAGKYSLMGHTFICDPNNSYSIEVTSKHIPVIKKLDRTLSHARTNHGYDYSNSGYTKGPNYIASLSRWKIAQKVLDTASTPNDILTGLGGYWPVNMRDNPYRNKDMVKNATKNDVLSTTSQILINLTDLEFNVRIDRKNSKWLGIDDRTPGWYTPKIKIKVQYITNREFT